jgi:hypothetical protein
VAKKNKFVEAAEQAGIPVEPNEALKADNPSTPATPKPVYDGKLLAAYVLPHYKEDKNGDRVIEMEFSFPLTPEHKSQLPDGVEEAWRFVSNKNHPSAEVTGIPAQVISIWLAPDMAKTEELLHLPAAQLIKAKVRRVEEKGKGAVKTVIRFSFRILCDVEEETCEFADNHFGKMLWLEMDEKQGRLKLDA